MLLTGNNTVAEGISAFKYRLTGIGEGITDITYAHVLKCIWDAVNEPFTGVLFGFVLLVIMIYAIRKKYLLSFKERLYQLIPIFIISISPFSYYCMVINHVLVHPWLEYRELAVTIWGYLLN